MTDTEKLTDEQIENWRRLLRKQYGPMTDDDLTVEKIQEFRDNLQHAVNKACEN